MENNRYKYAAKSDPGKVRQLNEDNFLAEPDLDLWLIADGMGGHEAGDVASSITCQSVLDGFSSGGSLVDSIRNAHEQILEQAAAGKGAEAMGSTVVAVHVTDNEYEIAWVGDSRAYLFDGNLLQVSWDHSHVQNLVNSGAITAEEALTHPDRHLLTNCLGVSDGPDFDVSTRQGRFSSGQEILLCSDGLTDELADSEIEEILSLDMDAEGRVDQLIDKTLERGGNDNVTVILFSGPDCGSKSGKGNIAMLVAGAALAAIILGAIYYLAR